MLPSYFLILFVASCSGQFLECTKNEDCQAETAVCEGNLCKCPTGSVLSADVTKCLPVTLGFDGECEDNQQCGWLLGDYECISGKCRCAAGWAYAMGRCVKISFLNRNCNSDSECFNGYDLLAMVCKESKCVCNDQYYPRDNFDCRPAITKVGEYCSLDSDCKFTNGKCRNSVCVDGSKSIRSPNAFSIKENPFYRNGTNVVSDLPSCENCSSLANAMCYSAFQKCYCKRGYTFNPISKKCVAELGVSVGCTKDDECQIPYSRCVDGKCYCRKTYFTLADGVSCQKPMTNDNLFCNTDERCYALGPYSKCNNGTCECSTGSNPNDAFVCDAAQDCSQDVDCIGLQDSVCLANVCQCRKGYRPQSQSCVPNLGSKCLDKGKCTIENASCDAEDVCTCNANFVASGETACLPLSTLDSDCQIDEQCSMSVESSKCDQSKCKCMENFIPLKGRCVYIRKMGDQCSDVAQCHVSLGPKVVCRNGFCNCPANMKMNAQSTDCESSATSFSPFSHFIVLLITLLRVF